MVVMMMMMMMMMMMIITMTMTMTMMMTTIITEMTIYNRSRHVADSVYVCMCVCMYACMRVYVCVFVCVGGCGWVWVCVHPCSHRHRRALIYIVIVPVGASDGREGWGLLIIRDSWLARR